MGGNLAIPGTLIPDQPMKKRSYASPLSYMGSARRLWASTDSWRRHNLATKILAWVLYPVMVYFAWVLVTGWYLLLLPFLVVLIPFRLVRRNQRRQEHRLEAMQAMMIQQQAALGGDAVTEATAERRELPAPGPDPQQEVQDLRNWT
jgi:hypothetical protein